MRSPDGGDPIEERQFRMRIGGDVQHREIALYEGPGEGAKCERDEDKLPDDGRTAGSHPCSIDTRRASQAENCLGD